MCEKTPMVPVPNRVKSTQKIHGAPGVCVSGQGEV